MIRRTLLMVGAGLLVYIGCSQQTGNPPESMPPNIVADRCVICHADIPPRDSATETRIHYRHFKFTGSKKRCDKCHGNYDTLMGWKLNSLHRDGLHEPSTDTTQVVCKACHDYRDCWKCHNSPDDADFHPAAKRVHSIHYNTLNYVCNYCHKGYDPDNSTAPPNHNNGKKEVIFGFDNRGMTARYDTVTQTCYNIYCHGATMPGGKTTVRITDIMSHTDSIQCSFCHDINVLRITGTHAKPEHSKRKLFDDCLNCHDGYSVKLRQTNPKTHINGAINRFPNAKCNECHDANHQLPVPP